jgi:eukaryotic-like serine/threonine-protein kinase
LQEASCIVEDAPMQPYGPFMLIDALASGGMGEVWLASPQGLATATDELCVLKRVKSVLADDDDAVRRFVDESRLGLLLRHPCVARTVDAGRVDGSDYLAVELVEGLDLRVLSERASAAGTPLDAPLAMWCLVGAFDGLAAAHAARHPLTGAPLGVVHRDISPHNLMAARDGVVRVIDFGLALSAVREARTEQGVVMGKLAYMSPEQARGEAVDDRCDVFAAGVVLYELITGERYWGGLPQSEIWQLVGRGTFRARQASAVDVVTGGLFSLLTAPRAAQRPSAAEARDALLGILDAGHGTDALTRRLGALVAAVGAPELARIDQAREAARSLAPTIGEPPRTTISLALAEVRAVEALLQQPAPAIARHAPSNPRPLPGLMVQASTALIERATPTALVERAPPGLAIPKAAVRVVSSPSTTAPTVAAAPAAPPGLRRAVGLGGAGLMVLAVLIGVGLGLRETPAPEPPSSSPPTTTTTTTTTTTAGPVVAPPPAPPPPAPEIAPPPEPPPVAAPAVRPARPSADEKLLTRMRALSTCSHACAASFKEPARRGLAGLSPSLRAQLPALVLNCEKLCRR